MKRDFSRQSFLPANSEAMLASIKVGVIGLCGGGSHIVQQLAHVGVLNYVVLDPDGMDKSNLKMLSYPCVTAPSFSAAWIPSWSASK